MTDVDARPGDEGTPPEGHPKEKMRERVHRGLVVLGIVLAAFLVVGAAGFGTLWIITPSVASAPSRTAAILAAHHDPSDKGLIAPKVEAAVLATEDSRFYSDPALDPAGVVRAMWGLLTNNPTTGGATIEVQLAKLLYTGGQRTTADKFEQVVLAFKLDQRFSKTKILGMYLDAAYFGDGAYGITAAASRYFGVTPGNLSWGQAALIAGLLQAPSAYDPRDHLHLALARQHQVLGRLVDVGALSKPQAAQISKSALHPAITFSG